MTVILYAGRTGRHIYYDICRQVMSAGNPSGKGPPDRTGKSGKSLPQGESHAAPKSAYAQEAAGFYGQKAKKR